MSCMRSEVLKEAKVIIVDEYSLISSADVIKVRRQLMSLPITTLLFPRRGNYVHVN